jgi:PPOX class probable F420-dependent enzyme
VNGDRARRRFAAARVATLATLDPSGAPHLVPVTFAVDGATVWTAVDGKPKRGRSLRRHTNVRADPRVSLLVQHWDEDWARLWWVRADGLAVVDDTPETVERVAGLLAGRYDQYRQVPVHGPVIGITVHTWRGWSATDPT